MGKLFIGTSGYNYKDWKDDFYPTILPQKAWLHYFSTQFSTVEINATFYRSFLPHVYANWYNQTTQDFLFTLKGPRTITHIKRLKNVDDDVAYFLDSSSALKEKRNCLIWQFPATFKQDEEKHELLQQFLKKLPKDVRHAIELRHASWFEEKTYELLKQHNAAFVISETSQFAAQIAVTADFIFIRFHGPRKLYASSYTTEELTEWSKAIKQWLRNHDVYCYFNNDFGGRAHRNARELQELILSK